MRSVYKHLLLQLFFIVLFSAFANAYDIRNYKFNRLTIEGGLKNSRCVATFQDEDGYMWFFTHSGVDRFNGTDLKHYSLYAEGAISDNDNIVNMAIPSKKHDIICASKSGNIYYYCRHDDYFKPLFVGRENEVLFNVYALYEDEQGNLWIGNSSGLFYYDINAKKLDNITQVNEEVLAIAERDEETLWLATSNGLFLFDTQSKQFEAYALNDETRISSLFKVDENTLIVGTDDAEIYNFRIYRDQVNVSYKNTLVEADSHPIKSIVPTPEGYYALGIDGQGVFMVDEEMKVQHHYKYDKDDMNSISSNGVYALYYSKNDIFWVATWGGGVCFSDPNQKPFQIIKHLPYIENSLLNNTVGSIAQVNNKLWFGTKEGISRWDVDRNTWSHFPDASSHLSPFITLHLYSHNDEVWAATYGQGLLRFSSKGKLIDHYHKDRMDGLSTESNHLYGVLVDDKNRVWTAGIWGKMSVFDFSKRKKEVINLTNIRAFYEGNDEMYVGTLFGLFMVDKENLSVSRTNFQQLNSSRIICITKHPEKDVFYFGTDANGLLIWDKKNNKIRELTIDKGLPSNYIRSLTWEDSNHLWVATTEGLSHLDITTLVTENYSKSDGMSANEFSENASVLYRNGMMYLGTTEGVTAFNPNNITKSALLSIPELTAISVLGETLEIDPKGPLTKNINLQKEIVLPYEQNSITFEFAAIAYTNPDKVKYQWRLKGLNDNWQSPSHSREANYIKIPAGKYQFQLKASNEDGVWSDDMIKTIDLHILKPLWRSWWAWSIYFLAIVGIIYLLLKYYRALLHDQHSMEKQQFFISIAHDLRTPLSLIKLPVEKMVSKAETLDENRERLVKVKRNVDRLTNLVNQLLDFQKVDLNKMNVQAERINLAVFLEERVQAFEPMAIEKNISLFTDFEEGPHKIYLDKDKMEKIMYNLLSNAFKYTPKGGEVNVSLEYSKKTCQITVSDTGEGIPSNQQSNIFKRYYRASNAINSREVGSGVGLMLTKQLVELLNGDIKFESEYGKGTSFIVSFPLKSKLVINELTNNVNEEAERVSAIVPSKIEEKVVGSGEKVLIVEDNPELRQELVEELSDEYQVIQAADGEEGVKYAQQYQPRIIVSDVMMPNKSGHELCSELKEALETCHIPIILLTALDSPEYKREGLEYGADAYMEKPFELKVLKAQIKNLIKNRETLKKKFLLPSATLVVDDKPVDDPNEKLLNKVKTYVLEHILDDQLSVESVAIEVGLSRPVLYRKIKSLTDLSPQQFLLTIRLNESARLLKSGTRNVSEVAYETGFTDPKYFSQVFKKHFGKTPSQYVKAE